MLMANPVAFDGSAVSELKKMMEKNRITNVIAPEHNKRHHDHENKMKNEEKSLLSKQLVIVILLEVSLKNQLKEIGLTMQCLN